MEGVVQGGDDVCHIGDEVRLAGNKGLNLRDEGLIGCFFSHEDKGLRVMGYGLWVMGLVFTKFLIHHRSGKGIELHVAFWGACGLILRCFRVWICAFGVG